MTLRTPLFTLLFGWAGLITQHAVADTTHSAPAVDIHLRLVGGGG